MVYTPDTVWPYSVCPSVWGSVRPSVCITQRPPTIRGAHVTPDIQFASSKLNGVHTRHGMTRFCLSVCLYVCLSVRLSVLLTVHPPFAVPMSHQTFGLLPTSLMMYTPDTVWPNSVCLSVCLSICLYYSPSIRPPRCPCHTRHSVCLLQALWCTHQTRYDPILSVRLSVCLYVCPSVCITHRPPTIRGAHVTPDIQFASSKLNGVHTRHGMTRFKYGQTVCKTFKSYIYCTI